MINHPKPLMFIGSSQKDLRAMSMVGEGAYEIRHRDASGAFRVIYVAKLIGALK